MAKVVPRNDFNVQVGDSMVFISSNTEHQQAFTIGKAYEVRSLSPSHKSGKAWVNVLDNLGKSTLIAFPHCSFGAWEHVEKQHGSSERAKQS